MSIDLGAAIYIALKPILKIYTIMAVGFLLARYNIVTMEVARGVSNMVVNAILPCLTFNKIVGNISDKDIKEVGAIVLSAVILFALGTISALITTYSLKAPKQWFWGLLFAGFFPNISDLPIAYVQSMTNSKLFTPSSVDKGVAYCCIFLLCQSFCMMNFGMWRVVGLDFKKAKDEESNDGNGSHETISNPELTEENDKISSMSSVDREEEPGIFSLSPNTPSWTPQQVPPLQTAHLKKESSSLKVYRTRTVEPSIRSRRGSNHRCGRTSTNDVVNEYSAADQIRDGELDLSRPLTLTEELGNKNSTVGMEPSDHESKSRDIENPVGSGAISDNYGTDNKFQKFMNKYKLGWLSYFLINFIRPASLGASLGIIISMIPWLKALFVHTNVHVHNAPDGEPVLNFLMDFTSYIGNACVPLGLLLLGGTLARLQLRKLPSGIIRVAIAMTVFRLMIIPIVGVAWANKIYELNWISNPIGKFVMILTWAMPSATAQVYFTAFYTPLEGSHIQMDCLSVFFTMQYAILFITVPFVITYTLKEDLKY